MQQGGARGRQQRTADGVGAILRGVVGVGDEDGGRREMATRRLDVLLSPAGDGNEMDPSIWGRLEIVEVGNGAETAGNRASEGVRRRRGARRRQRAVGNGGGNPKRERYGRGKRVGDGSKGKLFEIYWGGRSRINTRRFRGHFRRTKLGKQQKLGLLSAWSSRVVHFRTAIL